jgi:hypothetical protein
MITILKKSLEKEQALREIWHKIKRFENSVIVKEIYKTCNFNNYAMQIRTRVF